MDGPTTQSKTIGTRRSSENAAPLHPMGKAAILVEMEGMMVI
jgi:hypothetical protein